MEVRTKWCPSCGKELQTQRETCPTCLTDLVDSFDPIVCRSCGFVCRPGQDACPQCMASLMPLDATALSLMPTSLTALRLPRAANTPLFQRGPRFTLTRTAAGGALLFLTDDLIEATLNGSDRMWAPPFRCDDVNDAVLFEFSRYTASANSWQAVDEEGSAIASYHRRGNPLFTREMDVRDQTSAPVARLITSRTPGVTFDLVETGGPVIAEIAGNDNVIGDYVDDIWQISPKAETLPLTTLGCAGLLVAIKLMFGRLRPEHLTPPTDDQTWLSDSL